MTIKEFAGIKSCNIDIKTGKELSFTEKYERIVNLLGYENVKRCIPFTLEEIKEMYLKDEHMNFNMKKWEDASGVYISNPMFNTKRILEVPLVHLYRKHRINTFSQADGVCILKCCARMWLNEVYRTVVRKEEK